jgi:hypothetical protein
MRGRPQGFQKSRLALSSDRKYFVLPGSIQSVEAAFALRSLFSHMSIFNIFQFPFSDVAFSVMCLLQWLGDGVQTTSQLTCTSRDQGHY